MQNAKPPLRIGFWVDSLLQPNWVCKAVSEVVASPFCTISMVGISTRTHDPEPSENGSGLWSRVRTLADDPGHLLYDLYTRLDTRRFSVDPDPFAKSSIAALVDGAPVLRIAEARLSEADVAAIARHELDVLVYLGSRRPRGANLDRVARHGVWFHRPGGDTAPHTGPPAFWEVMNGDPVVGSSLQMVTDGGRGERTLSRSFLRTDRLSVHTTRVRSHWRSATFLPSKLRELYELGPEGFDCRPRRTPPDETARGGKSRPTNLQMIRPLFSMGNRRLRNRMRQAQGFDQWFMAFRFEEDSRRPIDVLHARFDEFEHLTPPPDRFWADPFPVFHDGKHYVFCEEYPYDLGKGHLSVLELNRDGTHTDPVVILDREFHLSYPFVFRWRGEYFMIPETEQNRRIELYRCTEFPYRWEPHSILMEGISAVDATLMEIDGRWWMFANLGERGIVDWDTELHLFHAPTPLGPWIPHARNPVKSDVRNSRPAGRPFRRGGEIFRPAQNCAERYGYGITFNRIVRITPTDFHEIPVREVHPTWTEGLIATHTINACPGLVMIDGKKHRSRRG